MRSLTVPQTRIASAPPRARVQRVAAVEVKTPPMAETAKTIVSTVHHGTLSTLSEDGTPLGTYVAYILDSESDDCTTGSVALVEDEASGEVRAAYEASHPGAQGLDVLREGDQFGRLQIDKVFYVGGLDGHMNAEEVSGEAFADSQPDPLRHFAPEIVRQWNNERMEDIFRLCKQHTGIPLSEMMDAELAWVDRFGFYISYETINAKKNILRVPFPREVEEDRDARSLMTMAAHLAWENDRNAAIPTP